MPSLTFITDETNNRRYVQIDLAEVSAIGMNDWKKFWILLLQKRGKVTRKLHLKMRKLS